MAGLVALIRPALSTGAIFPPVTGDTFNLSFSFLSIGKTGGRFQPISVDFGHREAGNLISDIMS